MKPASAAAGVGRRRLRCGGLAAQALLRLLAVIEGVEALEGQLAGPLAVPAEAQRDPGEAVDGELRAAAVGLVGEGHYGP